MHVPLDMSVGHSEGHLPLLARCIQETQLTKGPVLELGIGYGSTLVLKELCRDRELFSIESHQYWHDIFKGLESPLHKFIKVPNFNEIPVDRQWDIAFIDHGEFPARGPMLQKLLGKAKFVVMHDTESEAYGYNQYFHLYKYRFDYKIYYPWTTVVSNDIDVTKWEFPVPQGVHKKS